MVNCVSVHNNSTMTARHRTGCWKILFQLKSHRVNVPFNKDNFVDSYFLLSLSLYLSFARLGTLFAFCCLLLLAHSHQTHRKIQNYVSLWENVPRNNFHLNSWKQNKQTSFFFLSRSTIYSTLITRHYSKSDSAAMK